MPEAPSGHPAFNGDGDEGTYTEPLGSDPISVLGSNSALVARPYNG